MVLFRKQLIKEIAPITHSSVSKLTAGPTGPTLPSLPRAPYGEHKEEKSSGKLNSSY